MHQQLANYDPYTIQQVEFFVQKKTKYTTLKSILVSLAILALTVILNLSLVEQLWIGRDQLSVTSTQRKMSQEQFTQAYLCVIAKNTSIPLPNSTLYTFSQSLNHTSNIIPLTNIFNSDAGLLEVTQERDFQCYDLSGALINYDIYMQLNIYDISDNFDFIFRVYTSDQIMGKNMTENYVNHINQASGRYNAFFYSMKKINGIIYDSLLIDYEPETIYGFTPVYTYIYSDTSDNFSSVRFYSENVKPYDTTTSYTITRSNIGDILGKLLSWFSIFVMIAAFGVQPILQYNYKVQLAKKLYDHPKLTRISIDLLSYAKYILSFIKKGIFDQSILYAAFEQLQSDLDLLNLIKKQSMMKKIIKENQFVNKEVDQIGGNIAMIEHNDDDDKQTEDLFIGKFLNNQLMSQHNQENTLNNEQRERLNLLIHNNSNEIKKKLPLITTPDPEKSQSFIVSFFKSLDASQSGISLISNKGEGYKTSWNTILTALCLAGILWFIIFAGIFTMTPSYSLSSVAVNYDETVIANVTINPEDVLFRANLSDPTDNYTVGAFLLDQDDNVLDNITLLQGADCQSYLDNLNETDPNWMCLPYPVSLSNNAKGNTTKLGLTLLYSGFLFSFPEIEITFWQYNIVDDQLVKTKMYEAFTYSSSQVYKLDGQAIIYFDQNQQQNIPDYVNTTIDLNPNLQFWTCNQPSSTTQAIFKGVTFQIQPQMIQITTQVPTIWDVINNAWGIVVLAFSVFLSKITRYLNVKEREKISKVQENQSRNDIVSIVSTQYKLLYHLFAQQLEQVKYFYKSNFDDFGAKVR